MEKVAGTDISDPTVIEVFSNAVVVVSEYFLNEVPEDKVSFFNRVGAYAEVNIICNSKGTFAAQGSWRKVIAFEEALKNSLRIWRCDAEKEIGCSEENDSDNCAVTAERHSQQKQIVTLSTLNKDTEIAGQDKSSLECLESSSSLLTHVSSKANAAEISSPVSDGTVSVISIAEDDFKKAKEKKTNGNEIYVNITLTTNNSISLTHDETILRSENPVVSDVELIGNITPEQKKGTGLSENAIKESGDVLSKQLSEKDKRKLYEQQTPFKYFCTLCSFKSKRESHYKKHLLLHKKGTTKLFVCTQCGFRAIRLGHLRRHELQHSSQTLRCPWCPYTTSSTAFLQRHQRIKHASNPKQTSKEGNFLRCSHCNYMTSQPHFLERHLRVHGIGKDTSKNLTLSYQCEKCMYKTRRKEHFERHRRDVHSEARPFLCDACGKAFKRADALRQHRAARHHPFIANEGKIISDSNSSPSQYSLYCCQHCSKPCRSRAHLRDHLAAHSDERSFLCEICGSSFKTRAVQRKHVATVHANPKAFPCNRCVRRFSTKYALLRHLKIHGCMGISQPKSNGVSTVESYEILMESVQELVSTDETSIRTRRMEVQMEGQRQTSNSVRTSHEIVTVIPILQDISESKDAGSGEVTLEMEGEMHSINSGALTRTPAPSETSTALLYLTTDFTQY